MKPTPSRRWLASVKRSENGKPIRCMSNTLLYLQNLPELGSSFRYNMLSCNIEWRGEQIRDEDYVEIRLILEKAGFIPDKADVKAGIAWLARQTLYHPIQEYLQSIEWDGVARLDAWLIHAFGAPDRDYERQIGSKWLLGAVARVFDPGCQMDNVLVLEGAQGIGKSSALAMLFGRNYFTEAITDLRDHKRFVEQILGKWIVELAELAALRKTDVEAVKAVISMRIDRTTRSYALHATEHPRQCVMAATINPDEGNGYLTDSTGNRRFWPIRCSKADLTWLEEFRDQLWAEATHRFEEGEQWWLDAATAETAASEQQERAAVDPWQEALEEKLQKSTFYTSNQILCDYLMVPTDRQEQKHKNRLARVLKALGWRQRTGRLERVSARLWEFPCDN